MSEPKTAQAGDRIKPTIFVCDDPRQVAVEAAKRIIAAANGHARRFTLALSGGSTPKRLFELLANPEWSAKMPWSRTHLFWGDERHVPSDAPDSNFRMTREALLDHVEIPPVNIHRVPTELDPRSCADAYQEAIYATFATRQLSDVHFDLCIQGMGADGHTASLFPNRPTLKETSRAVVADHVEKLNQWRITLTLPVINAAREVLFLVTGEEKAATLKQVLFGPSDGQRYPSQLVQPSGKLVYLVDKAAASQLPRESYTLLQDAKPATVILLMGVSGAGKSTIGGLLSKQLNWTFADADDFHPAANVAKMRSGTPLNDDDRRPWLQQLGRVIQSWLDARECAILACSALKERYREMLGVNDSRVKIVYLKGNFEDIDRRLQERSGHYMNPKLLHSQFEALEPPHDAIVADVNHTPEQIVAFIRHEIGED